MIVCSTIAQAIISYSFRWNLAIIIRYSIIIFKKDIANIYKLNGNSNDVIHLGQAFLNSTYTYLFVFILSEQSMLN